MWRTEPCCGCFVSSRLSITGISWRACLGCSALRKARLDGAYTLSDASCHAASNCAAGADSVNGVAGAPPSLLAGHSAPQRVSRHASKSPCQPLRRGRPLRPMATRRQEGSERARRGAMCEGRGGFGAQGRLWGAGVSSRLESRSAAEGRLGRRWVVGSPERHNAAGGPAGWRADGRPSSNRLPALSPAGRRRRRQGPARRCAPHRGRPAASRPTRPSRRSARTAYCRAPARATTTTRSKRVSGRCAASGRAASGRCAAGDIALRVAVRCGWQCAEGGIALRAAVRCGRQFGAGGSAVRVAERWQCANGGSWGGN
eukprot:2293747-Prymnesium_polylepis.1